MITIGHDFETPFTLLAQNIFLKKYSKMKMGIVENMEGIELIRAIENNLNLGTFVVKGSGFAVDVNQDLMRAIDIMPKDRIRKLY